MDQGEVQAQNAKVKDIVASNEDDAVKIDKIAAIRGWFRPGEQSVHYPTIQEYLNGKINLAEATRKLFNPIDEKISASKLDDVNFFDWWLSIIHSAKRVSFRDTDKHSYLIDLVVAFRDHQISGHEKYNYLYSSLTDFGMSCREVFNDAPSGGASEPETKAWANVNFFWARVTARKIQDLSLYAIWTMREALEDVQQDDKDSTAAQKLDTSVPAAAVWILGMGKDLYQKEEDLTPSDRKQGNPARGGQLWKEKGGISGFNTERWALWKHRFTEISNMKDVSEKTRAVAKDTIQAMERSETFEIVSEHSNEATQVTRS